MQKLGFLLFVIFVANTFANTKNNTSDESFSVPLNKENFDAETKATHYLVIFYAAECELSQKFLPKFEKLAQQLNVRDDLKLGRVNCAEDNDLCKNKNAKALDVFLYRVGEKRVQFNGVKNENGLSKFLIKNLGDIVVENLVDVPEKLDALNELTDETFQDHVAVGQHFVKFYAPWCGHCQRLAPTWDELATALEYDPTVSISKVDCTQHRPICQDFEVKGYPTLLWIVDGKKIEKYSGARSIDDFKAYIEQKAGVEAKKAEAEAGHQPEGGVVHLTIDNFEHGIEQGVTIVKFFAPWCGHCKRLAKTWDDLAEKFVGNANVKVGKVDCTLSENRDLCSEQEVDGFPTIYIYRKGEKITEYNGSRSLEDLFEFVNKYATGHDEL